VDERCGRQRIGGRAQAVAEDPQPGQVGDGDARAARVGAVEQGAGYVVADLAEDGADPDRVGAPGLDAQRLVPAAPFEAAVVLPEHAGHVVWLLCGVGVVRAKCPAREGSQSFTEPPVTPTAMY